MRVFIALLILASVCAAELTCGTFSDPNKNGICTPVGGASTCDAAYFTNLFRTTSNPFHKQQFTECASIGGSCCPDPCAASGATTPNDCINTQIDKSATPPKAVCAVLPSSSIGSVMCVSKQKLCMLLTEAECTARNSYCEWGSGACTFKVAVYVVNNSAPVKSADDECQGTHPIVIVMLVLMFVSLVIAVIIVTITVVQRQKEADKEEAEEEARAAAQAGRAQNVL